MRELWLRRSFRKICASFATACRASARNPTERVVTAVIQNQRWEQARKRILGLPDLDDRVLWHTQVRSKTGSKLPQVVSLAEGLLWCTCHTFDVTGWCSHMNALNRSQGFPELRSYYEGAEIPLEFIFWVPKFFKDNDGSPVTMWVEVTAQVGLNGLTFVDLLAPSGGQDSSPSRFGVASPHDSIVQVGILLRTVVQDSLHAPKECNSNLHSAYWTEDRGTLDNLCLYWFGCCANCYMLEYDEEYYNQARASIREESARALDESGKELPEWPPKMEPGHIVGFPTARHVTQKVESPGNSTPYWENSTPYWKNSTSMTGGRESGKGDDVTWEGDPATGAILVKKNGQLMRTIFRDGTVRYEQPLT